MLLELTTLRCWLAWKLWYRPPHKCVHRFWAQSNMQFLCKCSQYDRPIKSQEPTGIHWAWATSTLRKCYNEFNHQIWVQSHQWFVCKCSGTPKVWRTDERSTDGQRNRLIDKPFYLAPFEGIYYSFYHRKILHGLLQFANTVLILVGVELQSCLIIWVAWLNMSDCWPKSADHVFIQDRSLRSS